jgi:hypothetical protein
LKPITVSKLMDNAVEVAEGISTSDRVVNNPSAALLEGDKVRIVTPAPGYDLINAPAGAPEVPKPAQVSQPRQVPQRPQSSEPAQAPPTPQPPQTPHPAEPPQLPPNRVP